MISAFKWIPSITRSVVTIAVRRYTRTQLFEYKRCSSYTLSSSSNLFSYSRHLSTLRDSAKKPKAVIFDIGGVVIPSPFPLIERFERNHRLPIGSINATIKHYGHDGAFKKLERGEITLEGFCVPFSTEYSEFNSIMLSPEKVWGLARGLGGLDVTLKPFKEVVGLMSQLKKAGIKVAIITNNFKFDDGKTVLPTEKLEDVDVFIQSCIEGISKPDPLIYERALEMLGTKGEETVFLDDIGSNLKAAANLGITTIKVDDVGKAIREVEDIVFDTSAPKGTSVPSPKLQLPIESLTRYLQETHGLSQEGPPLIRSFDHGQSNPTYYIECGGSKLVLRKKPPGKLLPSAHAVEREYRVMKAVKDYNVPVPNLLSLCEDESIVGTPFYLMEYVEGRIFKDASLPSLKPDERNGIYSRMCEALASIHNVSIEKANLYDYGKQGNYVRRQIDRWSKQYRSSMTHEIPAMEELLPWLQSNTPESDTTTIVHGDFRLDNLIFSADSSSVLGVLDWELSTLGDPLSDLANACLAYHRPHDNPLFVGLSGLNLSSLGIPSEEEFLAQYCELRGMSSIPNWSFYMAFTFFRVAAILQGVYKRSLTNQSSAANSKQVGLMAESFAEQGWSIACGGRGSGTSHSPFSGRRSFSTHSSSAATTDLLVSNVSGFPSHLQTLREKLLDFMETEFYPNERVLQEHQSSASRWKPHPLIDKLKDKARRIGLWNLFLPIETDPNCLYGRGLTNLEYAHLAEIMGQSIFASEVFNCSPPDTGNMEVLVRYGTEEQKSHWLLPLLNGDIRSCFAMTEPNVASSDATNIQSSIVCDGDHYVLNGHKWWISGAMDPRCAICIFMGKTDPQGLKHKQQSMVLVPMDTPGVHVLRPLTVFGYDDAPSGHAEIIFENVRVPRENLLLGEGRGFEIAQGRLGPGRIHHCMRLIGLAERSLELMNKRVQSRVAFGKTLSQFDTIISDIAQSRLEIEQARLLTLKAAHKMDTVGNKVARSEIAMIKVVAPNIAQRVIDRAIQAHGALGLSEDVPLAQFFAWSRILRFADGPDEVHKTSIGKSELKRN
ncbi:PREDICTED: acyl-CoA dehydrogenase family member 10 [Amphimedon queenslandica]|uniref:Acyl-CoA dehydrogenase family member 10 n=1 Tax=Amphimedon queenslandica TaxID=400682 RepID=A0A1X7V919_AMPQE|nr:PREDICTED: acyl-CoA dehydrogenase family member 10 [Amphimedon queenslandica]|eukprot:XP_019850051.1 PREDICTED: acyl-CoA dehydrogenase family member 10 [Amphimedon queenslandica]